MILDKLFESLPWTETCKGFMLDWNRRPSMRPMTTVRLLGTFLALSVTLDAARAVSATQSEAPVPEASLIDVGIRVFDPGLPHDAAGLRKLEAKGIFSEVRESEAVYIPLHLERTLQKTGQWGAVRLSPETSVVDVSITGTILASDGNELSLDVRAVDSRGKVWLDKRYKAEPDESVYLQGETTLEPFQSLYDRLSNDLLAARRKVGDADRETIASLTRLRFAADLAPVPFADYIEIQKNHYQVVRLPARDDPMMQRVERLRQRDRMFIDSLDKYYADFYDQMREAYRGWRSETYWEHEASSSSSPMASGGGVSVGRIGAGGGLPWEGPNVICGTPAVMGGFEQEDPNQRAAREAEARKQSHLAALRELGGSLASDMAPQLVELEGRVLRLTGSVERQYAEWRELLREIFTAESGQSLD